MPLELTRWAGEQTARIVVRHHVSEAIAAARDTGATLLIVDCDLVDGDPEKLAQPLEAARLPTPTLCMGDPKWRTLFLTQGVSEFVDGSLGWQHVLAHATRLLEKRAGDPKLSSGVRRTAKSVIQIGPLVIELSNRRAFVNEEPLALRPAEFEVLVLLALNKNRPVSATEIVQHALATHGDGSSARNQLFELRRKLRDVGLQDAIRTMRNQGYQLILR